MYVCIYMYKYVKCKFSFSFILIKLKYINELHLTKTKNADRRRNFHPNDYRILLNDATHEVSLAVARLRG